MTRMFFGSHQIRKVQRYGWIPDHPDVHRPRYARLCRDQIPIVLPSQADLRKKFMPECYDQGNLGSCTANAISGAIQYMDRKEGLPDFMPSRLFIYYNERLMEGTVGQDAGAMIHDGVKSVATAGVCAAGLWPYWDYVNTFTIKPNDAAYKQALKHEALQYMSVDNTNLIEMKSCLSAGFPIIIGFTVYDGFESEQVAQDGIVNLPTAQEQVQGGHAVLIVGYDDNTQRFIVRNSWGISWGMGLTKRNRGNFTIPYSYFTDANLADDAWTIRRVGKAA